MRRRIAAWLPALLLALGAAQIAGGAWIHAKALLAQTLLEVAWRCTLAADADAASGAARMRPWPWADTWPVARLEIPRLGASMIVLAGDSGRTLAFGPGHTPGSSLPGARGTAIVSGHRDTHFAVLAEVRPHDQLRVQRGDGRIAVYTVESTQVVDSRTTRVRADGETDALVLVTCWPFDAWRPGGPLRLVVTARADAGSAAGQAL